MLVVKIVVDNRVRIERLELPESIRQAVKDAFTHKNPQHYKLKAMGRWPGVKEPPVIRTWVEDDWGLTVPRGGLKRVREIFDEQGVRYRFVDLRKAGDIRIGAKIPDYAGYTPRDYQTEAVDRIVATQNCLLRAGTASGKTEVAIIAAAKLKLPTLVIVWMSGLMKQWRDRLGFALKMKPEDIGQIRGPKHTWTYKPITLAMQQTLWNGVPDKLRDFPGFVVVDECHRAASKTLSWVVDQFPAKYRLGVSDNEKRTDGKEFLIYDQFGAVALEVPFNQLADEGYVVDVEIRVIPTGYMPQGDGWHIDRDFNALLDEMTVDEKRNALVVAIAKHEASKKQQMLVMSHRVEHAQTLDATISANHIRSGLLLGGKAWEAVHEATCDGLRNGSVMAGIGTLQSVGTGVDLPTLSNVIATTPIANNENTFRQVRGRAARKPDGKTDARLYILWDERIYPHHLANLMRWSRRVVVLDGPAIASATDQWQWIPAADWKAAHKRR